MSELVRGVVPDSLFNKGRSNGPQIDFNQLRVMDDALKVDLDESTARALLNMWCAQKSGGSDVRRSELRSCFIVTGSVSHNSTAQTDRMEGYDMNDGRRRVPYMRYNTCYVCLIRPLPEWMMR